MVVGPFDQGAFYQTDQRPLVILAPAAAAIGQAGGQRQGAPSQSGRPSPARHGRRLHRLRPQNEQRQGQDEDANEHGAVKQPGRQTLPPSRAG